MAFLLFNLGGSQEGTQIHTKHFNSTMKHIRKDMIFN